MTRRRGDDRFAVVEAGYCCVGHYGHALLTVLWGRRELELEG